MENTDVLRRAWDEYYASIAATRDMIENTPRFQNHPELRAQAYRTLLEAQAMAYNFAVAPRLDYPRINVHSSWSSYFYTLGGNGADFVYSSLFLDGRRTYRLTGRWGDVKVLLMQRWSHLLGHSDENDVRSENYDFADFQAQDGSFEITVDAQEHEGNWIRLDPGSNYNFFLIRRILADWNDDPGELKVEALGPFDTDHELDELAMAERIRIAAVYLKYVIRVWTINIHDSWLKQAGDINKVVALPGDRQPGGSPTSLYAALIWDLQPDEALIIEMDKPDTAYWSFQLFDVWLRSLDFMHYQTDLNLKHAVYDTDNKVRAVLSLRDPGVPNWLDPRGRQQGIFVTRNYRAKTTPTPTARKVKLASLRQYLPQDTATLTPAQRQEALLCRRNSFKKMIGW